MIRGHIEIKSPGQVQYFIGPWLTLNKIRSHWIVLAKVMFSKYHSNYYVEIDL